MTTHEKIQQMIYSFNEKVGVHWNNEDKIKFAALVAAHEREECAKLCDGWLHADGDQCAAAIRARGEV